MGDATEKPVRFGKHKLAGILHSQSQKSRTCVITCHGLVSSKDSEKYVEIARRFCEEGISVFRFDFRGCGESGGKLEETTLTERIEDLGSALDFVQSQGVFRIGVMGSSLGGCVSILRAAEDGRINALITWATPCLLDELFGGDPNVFRRLRQDAQRYDLLEALKKVSCPVLIVHGGSDEIVPRSHARTMFEKANQPKEILIVEGADHGFTDPIMRKYAIEKSLSWAKKYLI